METAGRRTDTLNCLSQSNGVYYIRQEIPRRAMDKLQLAAARRASCRANRAFASRNLFYMAAFVLHESYQHQPILPGIELNAVLRIKPCLFQPARHSPAPLDSGAEFVTSTAARRSVGNDRFIISCHLARATTELCFAILSALRFARDGQENGGENSGCGRCVQNFQTEEVMCELIIEAVSEGWFAMHSMCR